jgi:hypothetical protein
LQLVGGPNATATSSISRRQSLAFACLSPEPTQLGTTALGQCSGMTPAEVLA